ncbi:aliphatic sulfonate ABC transporter permease SsuC [Aetokthonos hydrillicola Thurmond2011]|uniref:Aliphatic sulfonate ABC transporter permease SsuC n=1 Tax=Aetokthonos hydrillicola Thurmond2011 TaxID=2712845 RepID=A0AAP5I912_9CYAN|nr:aliphatic sulfonate ABC transporter permease SsuC [Aetokthonos hydrillicola]MBO3462564.1 aliphatic sulfonate ABC transporter permease SsuC [Aetokthonos hydrillicola CCALA 1050]MBW4590352.1 aliphatic sulfonate ABC transporter permease SsuC [Aetokthonos hydrillicola CCALA 1050]MDR9896894.1 aliphatic sulfonate ABC transporter permease SsuC [Aetokthonos hydrillicola Thurmond2011]
MRKHKFQFKFFNSNHIQSLIPWTVPVSILILWQLLSTIGVIPVRILPSPLGVIGAAIKLAESGELFRNISISAARAISGFLVGGSVGFSLGLLNGISPISEKMLDTSIQMLRNIPNLALIPLVILWFGIGDEARLFLVSLGVMFPIYLNTFHGIRSVDTGLIEMGKVYGLNAWGLFWRIILPGAMSSILVGVRFSLGIMWLTLIVAETIAADSGIGYMAMNAREFMQTDVVVLSILIYALLGKLADIIARRLESYWLQWNPSYLKA